MCTEQFKLSLVLTLAPLPLYVGLQSVRNVSVRRNALGRCPELLERRFGDWGGMVVKHGEEFVQVVDSVRDTPLAEVLRCEGGDEENVLTALVLPHVPIARKSNKKRCELAENSIHTRW